jgi:hypothetical protein
MSEKGYKYTLDKIVRHIKTYEESMQEVPKKSYQVDFEQIASDIRSHVLKKGSEVLESSTIKPEIYSKDLRNACCEFLDFFKSMEDIKKRIDELCLKEKVDFGKD